MEEIHPHLAPIAGGTNTGGGGGGGRTVGQVPFVGTAAGGSGIVIIRYSGPQAATGGTVVSANGYTTHTFTTSGTFTPALWNDLSGNNNNGTLINGVAWNPSLSGGVMSFDGVDDYRLALDIGLILILLVPMPQGKDLLYFIKEVIILMDIIYNIVLVLLVL
jgi:hypothetical protein